MTSDRQFQIGSTAFLKVARKEYRGTVEAWLSFCRKGEAYDQILGGGLFPNLGYAGRKRVVSIFLGLAKDSGI